MVPSITVVVMLILTSNAKNVKKQFEVKRRRSRAMSLVVYNRERSMDSQPNKVPGHHQVDIFSAKFDSVQMKRGRFEVKIQMSRGLTKNISFYV